MVAIVLMEVDKALLCSWKELGIVIWLLEHKLMVVRALLGAF